MRDPEAPRKEARPAIWAAEARLLLRYALRTRAGIYWLLGAVAWPLAYVALLGNADSSPLSLVLSLCTIPVGPLLWALFGARMSGAQGRELSAAWPAPRGRRALGASLALLALALLGSLTTLMSALLGAEAGFWHPFSYALLSLAQGLAMALPTILLWTAVGFAIGQRTRGVFRSILPLLAPIGMTLGYEIGQHLAQAAGSSPLLRLVSTSAAGWFPGVDAFGVGPWASIFAEGAWTMGLAAAALLAIAALSAYGRQITAGVLAVASVLGGVGLVAEIGRADAVIRPYRSPAAAAYESGAKSPARVTALSIVLSLEHPPDLSATATLDFMAQRRLAVLRFYLPPGLAVRSVRIDGAPAHALRAVDGWVTVRLSAALPAGGRASLRVSYSGDPQLLATVGGSNLVQFVSGEGWLLPAGTWYPLLGAPQPRTRFRLRLLAPAGYLSVSPYGTVRGSTGARPLQGTGESLQLVGGHLAELADLGEIKVYSAADRIVQARAVLAAPNGGGQATDRAVAACIGRILLPQPRGAMVWAGSFEGMLTPEQAPWQFTPAMQPAGLSGGMGLAGLSDPRVEYGNDFFFQFPSGAFANWLSEGRSVVLPRSYAALQLGGALFTACGSRYTDGFLVLNSTASGIARLPRPALRDLAAKALAAYAGGQLTEARLAQLLREFGG